jgi:transcriptional regulator with XRE-family HTH domain
VRNVKTTRKTIINAIDTIIMIVHTHSMAAKKEAIPLGATGEAVRANIQRLREAQNLGYAKLSRILEELGRSIPELGLRRIEAGNRRVDVDDLMALAAALGVSPATLLMPEAGRDASFFETKRVRVAWADKAETVPVGWLWGWLTAEHGLVPENELGFAGRALPRFRQEVLLNEMAQAQRHLQEYVHNRQAEQEGAADGDD